ncbi:HD-GYP domain-containing protein [Maridesulfovibrio hydrothermalis]|uniref:Metal dependent phosphohydrolase n=1 Tax=Maridesulfovibrio hydrothermalis AM13 = DSM 14728 TaxID=1121451 RepID=L0RGD7_9BACT|nr:HD-GYP domain-containing protein [Maridesulfovibrio hydrothermalis]CCO24631.1 Metal dependent phosphohydrolase [Maridesulfovibrio hydrothermalis AM13 = DSM 14728]
MKNIVEVVGGGGLQDEQSKVNLTIHQFAESLGNAIDAKDHCTCSHSEEVAVISQAIGVEMGLSAVKCELLHIAGHLHDIGKIGLPDSILKKSGKLTGEEYEIVKKHPVIGAEIVSPVVSVSGIDKVAGIILHHHERYDGQGYPHGLRGEEIPFGARIIAVADTLSAMASNRPYRDALPFQDIIAEIDACSGSQFDPQVVQAFMEISDKIEEYFINSQDIAEDILVCEITAMNERSALRI